MNIQSLSIVVPNKKCANNCPYCVSRMVNSDIYPNLIDINHPHYDINVKEYIKRLKFVSDNGCKTIILTGTSEPQQNKQFLTQFSLIHQLMNCPFSNIEMQCTGLFLTNNRDYIRFLRNFVGVNTIALSVSSLNDEINNNILGHNLENKIFLKELCKELKEYNFNIRICLNLNSEFNTLKSVKDVEVMMKYIKQELFADQVTFRELYSSEENTEQSKWIENHSFNLKSKSALHDYFKDKNAIGLTPYGNEILNCENMSVIYDLDCMGKNPKYDTLKYLILRPNCKLYSSWDSPASLVF